MALPAERVIKSETLGYGNIAPLHFFVPVYIADNNIDENSGPHELPLMSWLDTCVDGLHKPLTLHKGPSSFAILSA